VGGNEGGFHSLVGGGNGTVKGRGKTINLFTRKKTHRRKGGEGPIEGPLGKKGCEKKRIIFW